jgi:hypothetical protein
LERSGYEESIRALQIGYGQEFEGMYNLKKYWERHTCFSQYDGLQNYGLPIQVKIPVVLVATSEIARICELKKSPSL